MKRIDNQRTKNKLTVGKPRVEQETYWLDGEPISYSLAFKAVKNFNLRVGRDGGFSVSAPYATDRARVLRFIAEHEDFLRRALATQAKRGRDCDRPLTQQSFADGAQHTLLGVPVCLEICRTEDYPAGRKQAVLAVKLQQDGSERWVIQLMQGLSQADAERAVSRCVISEEINRLSAAVGKMLPVCAERVIRAARERGISKEISTDSRFSSAHFLRDPVTVRLRDMKSRWGSCHIQKGVVTLNQRLIFAAEDCLEYVLCHELCHFVYPNHGTEFHRLLDTTLPAARELRKKLNNDLSS